jgi:hypothetical protein
MTPAICSRRTDRSRGTATGPRPTAPGPIAPLVSGFFRIWSLGFQILSSWLSPNVWHGGKTLDAVCASGNPQSSSGKKGFCHGPFLFGIVAKYLGLQTDRQRRLPRVRQSDQRGRPSGCKLLSRFPCGARPAARRSCSESIFWDAYICHPEAAAYATLLRIRAPRPLCPGGVKESKKILGKNVLPRTGAVPRPTDSRRKRPRRPLPKVGTEAKRRGSKLPVLGSEATGQNRGKQNKRNTLIRETVK